MKTSNQSLFKFFKKVNNYKNKASIILKPSIGYSQEYKNIPVLGNILNVSVLNYILMIFN